MAGPDQNLPPHKGPYILFPDYWALGPRPATQMLNSDLRLQCKFSPQAPIPMQQHYAPPHAAPLPWASQPTIDNADVQELKDYLAGIDANIMVPQPLAPTPPAEEGAKAAEPKGWVFSGTGASIGSKDGGISIEDRRGIREYLASGYTRRNPDGFRNPDGSWNTIRRDDDFGGKWDDHAEIVGGKAERELFSASVAEGSFGQDGDAFGGSGRVLGASGKAGGQFSITQEGVQGISPGLRAHAGAEVSGSLLEGKVGTRQEYVDSSQTLAGGTASGSVGSGKAEGKVEAIMTAEQVTLGGKLGAEINLVEGKLEGDLILTPRRAVNGAVNLYNWAFNSDHAEPLDENWDIGITLGGELSGQVGAQAGAEARAGYENGKARAEAGAKIGLGIGAGVKARGGIVGVDKIWNGIKSAASGAWNWATGN